MKKVFVGAFLACACLCLLGPAAAGAEEFSADMVSLGKGGTFRGKIFMAKDKIRMEMAENVTITRMDKKVVWVLMPKEKMYMEQPFQFDPSVAATDKIPGEVERTLVGKEQVSGQMANKYRIVYRQNARQETIYQWLVPGIDIPVKTSAADGSWTMEYKNIKMGRQPDSLFELPAGYQKFSCQMPSMKGILEQMVE